jgi:hypothetical protein
LAVGELNRAATGTKLLDVAAAAQLSEAADAMAGLDALAVKVVASERAETPGGEG